MPGLPPGHSCFSAYGHTLLPVHTVGWANALMQTLGPQHSMSQLLPVSSMLQFEQLLVPRQYSVHALARHLNMPVQELAALQLTVQLEAFAQSTVPSHAVAAPHVITHGTPSGQTTLPIVVT